MNYRAQQCLTVNYNLNGKNNLNVFIVFRILDSPGVTLNGIFGNDNGGNDRYIAVRHNVTLKELRIGYGNGRLDLSSFPSKANPLTLNFSVLSVHYYTPNENNSLVYCNGKYVINFTGENTFSIGSISSNPTKYTSLKHIAYFSLYHGRFSAIDIKRIHKYLCERYTIYMRISCACQKRRRVHLCHAGVFYTRILGPISSTCTVPTCRNTASLCIKHISHFHNHPSVY